MFQVCSKLSGVQANHESKVQNRSRTERAISALDVILKESGFEADDLQTALEAIKTAKEIKDNKQLDARDSEYKNYIDKTLVYEDKDAFIYKRGDTKTGRWYFRMWDSKNVRVVKRALRTTDPVQALATARVMYIEIKGKIDRGERLTAINTIQLLELWDKKLKKLVTDVPHEGLTPGAYQVKRRTMAYWKQYMESLSLAKTPIDKIEPHRTRDFGTWMKNLPKQGYKSKSRSLEVINGTISEILRMYTKLAVRDKYISQGNVPEIDRLKMQRIDGYKRDILTEEQYERLWKYIQHNYITKKHNPERTPEQLEIRKIWKEFIFIMSNVGFRPKELLGMKMYEITENPNWDSKKRETDLLMKVRKENSKTGRARICVAPVRKRIERVLASYKKLGITHQHDDVLFISYQKYRGENEQRVAYTRDVLNYRLKEVLKASGIQKELEQEGKSISLYSFRHQYACWRLRYGEVPIHLLAKQMGTSVQKIEQTYGHIEVEQQADVITKAQTHMRRTGFVLQKPEVIEEDSVNYKVETIVSKSERKLKIAK